MKKLTEVYIKSFSKHSKDKVKYLTKKYNIPEWIIRLYTNKFNWYLISQYQKLSEDFIRVYADRVDWHSISNYQKLSEDFIMEFSDQVKWGWISEKQKLSEDFIRVYADRVDWYWISNYQKLSEDFIREFAHRVDWNWISRDQKLSEDFIREFSAHVNWNYIPVYQKLSEDFIREFADRVDWNWISLYQKLSYEFIREFDLKIPEDNWRFISRDEKLQKIKKSKKYEIQDDEFIIAYKGIRSDGYSKYNFQYHYEVGKTYECHADWNINNENSFGLSVWTFKNAKDYCNERIIKVKIHIDDVAALVHDSNKIRCQKFEVLEIVEEN